VLLLEDVSSPTNDSVVPAEIPVRMEVPESLSRTSMVVKAGFAAKERFAASVELFSITKVSTPETVTPVALVNVTLKRSAPVPPLTTSDEVKFEASVNVLEPVLADASIV